MRADSVAVRHVAAVPARAQLDGQPACLGHDGAAGRRECVAGLLCGPGHGELRLNYYKRVLSYDHGDVQLLRSIRRSLSEEVGVVHSEEGHGHTFRFVPSLPELKFLVALRTIRTSESVSHGEWLKCE